MEVRDPQLVSIVTAGPFTGYARHGGAGERVVACVALLMAMVIPGILLGSSPRR